MCGRYAPPSSKAEWPLAANILDPLRASVVADGPHQMRQVRVASLAYSIEAGVSQYGARSGSKPRAEKTGQVPKASESVGAVHLGLLSHFLSTFKILPPSLCFNFLLYPLFFLPPSFYNLTFYLLHYLSCAAFIFTYFMCGGMMADYATQEGVERGPACPSLQGCAWRGLGWAMHEAEWAGIPEGCTKGYLIWRLARVLRILH